MPKRCTEPYCFTITDFHNQLCKKHGGKNYCYHPNCNNTTKNGSHQLCEEHGSGIICCMIDCYNTADKTTKLCTTHATTPKCKTVGCSQPLKKNSDHCNFHSRKSRCPNCVDWIDSQKGQEKYDGHCARCFKRLFPDDLRSTNIGAPTLELKVRDFLNANYNGFIHDQPLYTHNCDCTQRRRVDHYMIIGNTILAIETDEHQHKLYDADYEFVRYNDLYMHFSGKWIFIRFNPSGYWCDSKLKMTPLAKRLPKLKEEIDKHLARIEKDENTELLEVYKLFFDGYNLETVDPTLTNTIIQTT